MEHPNEARPSAGDDAALRARLSLHGVEVVFPRTDGDSTDRPPNLDPTPDAEGQVNYYHPVSHNDPTTLVWLNKVGAKMAKRMGVPSGTAGSLARALCHGGLVLSNDDGKRALMATTATASPLIPHERARTVFDVGRFLDGIGADVTSGGPSIASHVQRLNEAIEDVKHRIHARVHSDLPSFRRQAQASVRTSLTLADLSQSVAELDSRIDSPELGFTPSLLSQIQAHSAVLQRSSHSIFILDGISRLQRCALTLERLEELLEQGQLEEAVSSWPDARSVFDAAKHWQDDADIWIAETKIWGELEARLETVRDKADERLIDAWDRAIVFGTLEGSTTLTIYSEVQVTPSSPALIPLSALLSSLSARGHLTPRLLSLKSSLLKRFILPILDTPVGPYQTSQVEVIVEEEPEPADGHDEEGWSRKGGRSARLAWKEVEGWGFDEEGEGQDPPKTPLDALLRLFKFLAVSLFSSTRDSSGPSFSSSSQLQTSFAFLLGPDVSSATLTRYLEPQIPTTVEELPRLKTLAKKAVSFEREMQVLGWAPRPELMIPRAESQMSFTRTRTASVDLSVDGGDSEAGDVDSVNEWGRPDPELQPLSHFSAHIGMHFAEKKRREVLSRVREMLLGEAWEGERWKVEGERWSFMVVARTSAQKGRVDGSLGGAGASTAPPQRDAGGRAEMRKEEVGSGSGKTALESPNVGQPSTEMEEEDGWGLDEAVPEPLSMPEEQTSADFQGGAPATNLSTSPRSAPGLESSSPSPVKEQYTISIRSKEIVSTALSILNDVVFILDSSGDDRTLRSSAATLYRAFLDVFDLYQAILPVVHEEILNNVPALAMQFHNDCDFLSRELEAIESASSHVQFPFDGGPGSHGVKLSDRAARVKLLGTRWYDTQITLQTKVLMECLDEAGGFVDANIEQRFKASDRALKQLSHSLHRLASVWKSVLPSDLHYQAIGRLVDASLDRIISDIEAIPDIGEAESHKLSDLCRSLESLETLFVIEEGKQSTVAFFVPHWFKMSYLAEILTGSLVDIGYLFETGALIDFSPDELCRLIRSLFADSPKRASLIDKISSSHPQ